MNMLSLSVSPPTTSTIPTEKAMPSAAKSHSSSTLISSNYRDLQEDEPDEYLSMEMPTYHHQPAPATFLQEQDDYLTMDQTS